MKSIEVLLGAGVAAGACTMGVTLAAGAPGPIAMCFGGIGAGFVALLLSNLSASGGAGGVPSDTGHGAAEGGVQAVAADGMGLPGQETNAAAAASEMIPWTGIMLMDRMQTGPGHTYFIEQAGGSAPPHEQA